MARERREKLPEHDGTILEFFPDTVQRNMRTGEVLRYPDGNVRRGYFGNVHLDANGCDPLVCRKSEHRFYFRAAVVLKAKPAFRAERGLKVVFAAKPAYKEGKKPEVVFMRSVMAERERPEKTIPRYGK
jgi:hypothetical protein